MPKIRATPPGPSENYVTDPAINGNTSLDRHQAIEYLVDDAINGSEGEWVGCSVLLVVQGRRTAQEAKEHIRELAQRDGMRVDAEMVDEIYAVILENQRHWNSVAE